MTENTIIRHHRRANFTVVDNKLLNDKTLSWAETGLMCYLLSLPDGWAVRTDDLMTRKTNKRDAVRNLQTSLAEKGYLQIDRYRDDKTKTWRRAVHVFEEPLDKDQVHGFGAVTGKPSRLTRHGSPDTAEPSQVSRAHSKEPVAKTQKQRTSSKETTTAAAEDKVVDGILPNLYAGICVSCDQAVLSKQGRLVGKKPAHLEGKCPPAKKGRRAINHITDRKGYLS